MLSVLLSYLFLFSVSLLGLESGQRKKRVASYKVTWWREAERDSQEELIWTAFKEEMEVSERLERVQKALESAVEDMDLMGRLLDELGKLQNQAQECDLSMVDAKISKLMPELGFAPEDGDRLVASFSSGWQMRMSLGRFCFSALIYYCWTSLQITLTLTQSSGSKIISISRMWMYEGNYSEYYLAKAAWIESQNTASEKQQKEIEHTKRLDTQVGRWSLMLERSWRNFRKRILLKGRSRGNR